MTETQDGLDLDEIEVLAEKQAAAYARMIEYGEGVGGLGARHPEMFSDMLAWGEAVLSSGSDQ